MRPVLLLVVLTALAEGGVALLLLLHLQRGFELQLGQIAAVFLPGFIVYSTLPGHLHGIVRQIGRTRVLSLALVCSAAFAAGLSVAPNPWVIAGMWVFSAVAFAAAIPVEQSIVAEAAGVSLGRAMGVYESATLLGVTVGTFCAGLLYSSGGGWRFACVGAAGLLLAGAGFARTAVRRVGVAEYPSEPAPPDERERPEPEPEPVPEPPQARERTPVSAGVRTWSQHVVLFVVVQAVLAVLGYSWPVEAVLGGPHEPSWLWNDSGHWLLDAGRIWCLVLVGDTIWTWGRLLLARRR